MGYQSVYTILLRLFTALLLPVSVFHRKAARMLKGRRESIQRIRTWRNEHPQDKVFWFHAASVGEFEQALPVMKLLKAENPDCRLAVSFFSPSGMEMRGNHALADLTFYLPSDLPEKMDDLVHSLAPAALILVKYEFWFNLLDSCRRAGIPAFSICCILRSQALKNPFLRSHLRHCLPLFTRLFIQNGETARILKDFGLEHFQISGDTRVDRVLEIKENSAEIDWIPAWKEGHKLLIIGSAWVEDLVYLKDFIRHSVIEADGLWRVLIVPHEIGDSHLQHLSSSLSLPCRFYSEWKENQDDCDILILDALGLLSRTYRYADAAWIGGAFKTGLHNTLEAAVYGIPVGFGPAYSKFQEARDLIDIGVARSFPAGGIVWEFFQESTENEDHAQQIRQAAAQYFQSQKGAADAIAGQILSLA